MIINLQNRVTGAIYRALFISGAARWLRRSDAVVFCYHNVIPDELIGEAGDRYLHIRLSEFSDQLEWITKTYTVVPINEILTRLRQNKPVAGLAAYTFDDGYAGAIRHAVPLLRSVNLPFALFPVVEAATHQQPFWWDLFDHLPTEDRIRFLNECKGDSKAILPQAPRRKQLADDALPAGWAELKSVLGDDCEFGVHTATHRNLVTLSREEIRCELEVSRSRLTTELGTVPSIVCYPYGLSNPIVEDVVERMGFQAGLSLASNLVRPGASMFNVPRINVPAGIALANFACWSSGLKLRR